MITDRINQLKKEILLIIQELNKYKVIPYSHFKTKIDAMRQMSNSLEELISVACLRDMDKYGIQIDLLLEVRQQIDMLEYTLEQKRLSL